MNALVRCKFYLVTLLSAVLLMPCAALCGDQTGASTGDIKQMTQKPTIMILSSGHLANPGMDGFNYKMDDVLAPKRQAEIAELVQLIKAFKPTKIALEVDPRFDTKIQANYQAYLKGTYELKRGEGDQIGFRLAEQLNHPKMYCVDYFWSEQHSRRPESEIDWDLKDYPTFAKTHNQEHFLTSSPMTEGKVTHDEDGTVWIEPEKYESMTDMYIRLNQPERRRADHQRYMRIAQIGLGTQYPGAHWVVHNWYARNFKIFVNLTRITESADDRILLIIGAGHVFLVQQFLEDSGDYIIESPLDYLSAEETQ